MGQEEHLPPFLSKSSCNIGVISFPYQIRLNCQLSCTFLLFLPLASLSSPSKCIHISPLLENLTLLLPVGRRQSCQLYGAHSYYIFCPYVCCSISCHLSLSDFSRKKTLAIFTSSPPTHFLFPGYLIFPLPIPPPSQTAFWLQNLKLFFILHSPWPLFLITPIFFMSPPWVSMTFDSPGFTCLCFPNADSSEFSALNHLLHCAP